MTGQHRLTDQDPGRAVTHQGGAPGHHRMHHLLRTARVYAQTLFDVVVLGTGTDHIAMDSERTTPESRERAPRPVDGPRHPVPSREPEATASSVRIDGSRSCEAYR
ncbi:hypothetical protein [Streptomyces sp. NPDC001070]